MFKSAIITSCLLLACTAPARCKTHYATVYNSFASIAHNDGIIRSTDHSSLALANAGVTPLCVLDSASRNSSCHYKYYARIANVNNEANKSYSAVSSAGNRVKIQNPAWGIVFNQTDTSCWAVALSCRTTGIHDDIAGKRTMSAKLLYCHDKDTIVLCDTVLEKGVNLYTGFNVVSAEVDADKVSVKIGDKNLQEIFSLTDPRLVHTSSVASGLLIGAGANVKVERSVIQFDTAVATDLHTPWTKAALDEHFSKTTDALEGYWTYLDRDMEDKWLRIGGRYTIALVKGKDGYDVIYVDGAKVKKSLWATGMLKATMRNTIFTNNYTATWIDATLAPISEDVYVTVEDGAILNFKFPVYKSQLRFSKVLPATDQ